MEQANFENNIFINCPFDKIRIDAILKPMIFCLVYYNFKPQLSLKVKDSGRPRIETIVNMMKGSRYSIHDLSLLSVSNPNDFARMNMPYELGIDYGLRVSGNQGLDEKRFLILGSKKYDYMKAISDLNGFDIDYHEDNTQKVFYCIREWIDSIRSTEILPSLKLYYKFMDFNAWLYDKLKHMHGEEVAFDYLNEMRIDEYEKFVLDFKKQDINDTYIKT